MEKIIIISHVSSCNIFPSFSKEEFSVDKEHRINERTYLDGKDVILIVAVAGNVLLLLLFILSEIFKICLMQNSVAEAASATQDQVGGSVGQGYNAYPTNAPVYASLPSGAGDHTGHAPSADYGSMYGTNYGY